jgi:ATP-dependent Lon protease
LIAMADAREAAPSTPANLPDVLPLLPLRDALVFPMAVVPLIIGQPRSIRLIDDVMRQNRLIALVAQRSPEPDANAPDNMYRVGTAATIHRLVRNADGKLHIVVQGLERIRLEGFTTRDPYFVARIQVAPEPAKNARDLPALRRAILDLFRRLGDVLEELPRELLKVAETLTDVRQLAYLVATAAPLRSAARQELLEMDPLEAKLRLLIEMLQK